MKSKKPAVRRYAEGTTVAAEKSRAELEALLDKHGAAEVLIAREAEKTTIVYRLDGRVVRHVLSVPQAKDFAKSDDRYLYGARLAAREKQRQEAADAEWRRRWRAQVLIVKAKLEIIASGESTVEREFLADVLLPNGETVGEAFLPRLAQSYASGDMPKLLLGSGS